MASQRKSLKFQLKSGLQKVVVSDPVEADEADRLLRDVIAPAIGKEGAIAVPGLVVNAKDVVSAEAFIRSSSRSMRLA